MVEGPFGDDAEALMPVEVEVTPMPARGTTLCGLLREKGYEGP